MLRTATDAAAIETSTLRLCIGICAAGSARFTCGSSASASASRAGPRSSGLVTRVARKRFSADATSISPSALRIAHAQELGPCTSTPFGESHAAEADLLVAHRSRGYPAADRSARCSDSAAGPGLPSPIARHRSPTTGITSRIEEVEKRLVRGKQPVQRERALLDAVARIRGELDERRPRHAGEDRQLERRRHAAGAPRATRHSTSAPRARHPRGRRTARRRRRDAQPRPGPRCSPRSSSTSCRRSERPAPTARPRAAGRAHAARRWPEGSVETRARPVGSPWPSRPGVQSRRSDDVRLAAGRERLLDREREPVGVDGRQPDARCRRGEPFEMRLEPERTARRRRGSSRTPRGRAAPPGRRRAAPARSGRAARGRPLRQRATS